MAILKTSSSTPPVEHEDWSDDLKALSDIFGDRPAHLVGWSLGAAVLMQFALDYPQLVSSLTFISPVSPFGFGGTKGEDGQTLL